MQHVSLFQPAYKISSVLLDADRAVDVGIRLDGQRDLGAVSLFLEALTSHPVDIRGESDTRYTRLELTKDEIVLAAKRPEVLWIEPSGERQAMVVAGLHDGIRPNDPEPGATHDGYEDWLLEKGFCTPSSAPSAQLIVAKYLYLYQGRGSSDPGMSELEYEDLMVLVADAGARFASNSVKPGSARNLKHYRANDFAAGSWYSKKYTVNFHPAALNDEHNNVKVVRVPAGEITSPFTLRVQAIGVNAKAVPGISGETENQDFALYVYNAAPTQ